MEYGTYHAITMKYKSWETDKGNEVRLYENGDVELVVINETNGEIDQVIDV